MYVGTHTYVEKSVLPTRHNTIPISYTAICNKGDRGHRYM